MGVLYFERTQTLVVLFSPSACGAGGRVVPADAAARQGIKRNGAKLRKLFKLSTTLPFHTKSGRRRARPGADAPRGSGIRLCDLDGPPRCIEAEIAASQTVLVFVSGFFFNRRCLKELYCALQREKEDQLNEFRVVFACETDQNTAL